MNLRKIMVGAVLAAAVAVVPAQALAKSDPLPDGVYVCNTAHGGDAGSLVVLGTDLQGGLHAVSGLSATGNGNYNAATHSRALALCGADVTSSVSDGSSGSSNY